MKILLDECLPKKLKHEFAAHEIKTVPEMGWAGKKNGELLKLMTGVFEVFVTSDQNLSYQQRLDDLPIAIIVLCAVSNRLNDLQALMPEVIKTLEQVKIGDFIEVGLDKP